MIHPRPRCRPRLAVVLSAFILTTTAGAAWAQNENETTGFRSNHLFERGNFGETIDVLNGGLGLTLPLGPRYQVNDRLGYQLTLQYNSKVWDYDDWNASPGNPTVKARLRSEGPLGVGFVLNFGRLIQDVHFTGCSDGNPCKVRTWRWVSADGGQHDVWWREDASSMAPPDGQMMTSDLTFTQVIKSFDGSFTVLTPDGLTYVLGHQVFYPEDSNIDNPNRMDNLSYGGWYVTRIEDQSLRDAGGAALNFVNITYDTRVGFAHIIKHIRDSKGRVINFNNGTLNGLGMCDPLATTGDRHQALTCSIDLPSFSGAGIAMATESLSPAAIATYAFQFVLAPITRLYPDTSGTIYSAGSAMELTRIDYPPYIRRDGTAETYSIYFGYGSVNQAELSCRTLPLPRNTTESCSHLAETQTIFTYEYDYYAYEGLFLTGGRSFSWTAPGATGAPEPGYWTGQYEPGFTYASSLGAGHATESRYSRQVVRKTIATPGASVSTWNYLRPATTGTNPENVTVTDANGNDTVYYYHVSFPPTPPPAGSALINNGAKPDDGLAPEWDDGLNYRIEYFKGTGVTSRVLMRAETRDYEADISTFENATQRGKYNTRMRRQATIFTDDGGLETTVSYGDWDKLGHWGTDSERGFQVSGTRTTRTAYAAVISPVYTTGLVNSREVHDGRRVLRRTDNQYDASGRLSFSIARNTLPAAIGTGRNTSAVSGDVKTVYTYDADSGAVVTKSLSTLGDGLPPDYCIAYEWNLGSYLKSKTYKDCATLTPLTWNSIDRNRDGNTGLIYSSTDTAGFETRYGYDALGRVTDIRPPSTEYPTSIDYVNLRETTVTRGNGSSYEFSRYLYDNLGRLVREERRPADAANGNNFRLTCYGIFDRVTFRSEWLPPGAEATCDRTHTAGTQFDYGTPPDPFGRVQQETTATGQVTTMTYQGLDSTVTVQGVMGAGGVLAPVTTRYFRDGWNRLVMVKAPTNGGSDAIYSYDLRDNLTQVDLVDPASQRLQSRFFEYNGLNYLYSATNPENGAVVYTDYDALGNVRAVTDASGTTLRHTFDAAGRLKQTVRQGTTGVVLARNDYDIGANAAGKITASYAYRDDGILEFTKLFSYAGLSGRLSGLTSHFQDPGLNDPQVGLGYNLFGDLLSINYPTGAGGADASLAVTYDYSNGYPTGVRQSTDGILLASITYNPAGGVATLTTPWVRTNIQVDSRNRPSDITIGKLNASAGSFTADPPYYESGAYSYDGAGNIYQIGPNSGPNLRYRYDGANRLKEAYAQYGGVNYLQCFSYDAFGNMTGKVDRTGTGACQGITQLDVILTATDQTTKLNTNRILNEQRFGFSGVANFLYDARGNLTKDWERRYQYDTRNRLTNVSRLANYQDATSTATDLTRYHYDNDGDRLVKRNLQSGLVTFYVRGPDGKLLSEFRRTEMGQYLPEWMKHHVYLAGREVALHENRVPSPPGALSASTVRHMDSSDVVLKWRKNPPEDNVTGYGVYRSYWGQAMVLQGTFIPSTCTSDPTLLCYSDLDLESDSLYQYQVTAVSGTLQSYGSDMIWLTAGDTTPPSPPTCLTGTAGDGRVSLVWQASVSGDVLGYNVYRSNKVFCSLNAPMNKTLVRGNTYTDAGLTNGTKYYYCVQAVDHVGNLSGGASNAGCVPALPSGFSATPKDYVPPAPPRDVMVEGDCAGLGTASLTWDVNADTDGVAAYWIYREPDFSPPGPRPTYGTSSFNDAGLSSSTPYYYWVTAQDSQGNVSAPSQRVGVMQRSSLVAVPPGKLILVAGDGQVKVRFKRPDDSTTIAMFEIYRKLNAVPSCGAFLQVGQLSSDGGFCSDTLLACTSDADCGTGTCTQTWVSSYLEFTDGAVPNAAAWDYAVAARDLAGNVSGFSESALAIPVAPPQDYHECIETYPASGLPDSPNEGWISTSGKRLVMKWVPPPGKPYHPLSASNADGTLGYLVGYHFRRHKYGVVGADQGFSDKSYLIGDPLRFFANGDIAAWNLHCSTTGRPCESQSCEDWETCIPMGNCTLDATTSCSSESDCVTGEHCYHTCINSPTRTCLSSSDCAGSAACTGSTVCGVIDPVPCVQDADCPARSSCTRFGSSNDGLGIGHPIPTDPYLLAGPDLVEYYPQIIFESADCGMIEAIYKVYADGNWRTVISAPTLNFDPGQLSSDPDSGAARRCLQWSLNQLKPESPACTNVGEPPSVGTKPEAAPTGPGKIQVHWDRPANLANVAGYYLYVQENSIGNILHPGPGDISAFSRPRPFIQLGIDETSYEFTNLSATGRAGRGARYQFQVAVYDTQGRVSMASPLSDVVTPPPSSGPTALKTVIWTVNDASVDGDSSWGYANPRGFDGIKLQWSGAGNRVYRSETSDGVYCAILKSGAGNPANVPICQDTSAYSDTATTGQSNTNTRFFLDKNVLSGKAYYYKVTNYSSGVESVYSNVVAGLALEHAPLPLSAPRHLKAWAVMDSVVQVVLGNPLHVGQPGPGIYLRWCPNPPQEQVTHYRIYRSPIRGGPYTLLAEIDNPTDSASKANNCLMGSRRCEIHSACTSPPCTPVPNNPTCTVGPGGTCKIVDLYNIPYPDTGSSTNTQIEKMYFYVVTAVRGTAESAYSNENAGWPNYYCAACTSNQYERRYDPDNEGDMNCDDEVSMLGTPEDAGLASMETAARITNSNTNWPTGPTGLDFPARADSRLQKCSRGARLEIAPYRSIGEKVMSGGGAGGGSAPPASARWLYYHADHLGSPRVITDSVGNVISKHHYMPFGEEKPLGPRVSLNASYFTGHERDMESASNDNPDGLDYMMARYYSSSLGRFMAVDPGDDTAPEDPQSWNKYAYVRNNPLNRTDPTGTRENIGSLHFTPRMHPTAAQVESAAKTVSSAAWRVSKASTAAGMIAGGTLQLPEAGVAFGGAGTAALIAIGADAVAAVAHGSESNMTTLKTDALLEGGQRVGAAALKAAGMPSPASEMVSTTAFAVIEGLNEGVSRAPDPSATSTAGQWEPPPPEVRDAVNRSPVPSQPVMNALPPERQP